MMSARSTKFRGDVPVSDSGKQVPSIATLAYALVAGGWVVAIFLAMREPVAVVSYERDIWHHLSVYRELMESLFHADNPHVATSDPSRSYSPWTMLVAFLARILGLDNFGALSISAVGTIIVFVAGIFLFSRVYWSHRLAPLVFLLAIFASWGTFLNHTGYTTVSTFLFSLSYPFGIVLALGFWSWWLAMRAVREDVLRWWHLVVLFLIAYFSFVTHQLHGLFTIGGTIGFLLFWGETPLKRRLLLGAAVLAGLIATKTWWYFDPIAYVLDPKVQHGHDAVRFLTFSLGNIPRLLATFGVALVGLLGFWNWQEKRVRPELLLPFLVLVAGLFLLLWRENWVSARIVPFVALYLQMGLVSYILTSSCVSRAAQTFTVVALLVGLVGNTFDGIHDFARARTVRDGGAIPSPPSTWSGTILEASNLAASLVPPDSTVIAQLQSAFPIEATELNVVAIPRLFAEVPDMLDRQANNRVFFAADTTLEEGCRILRKYDVQLIAWRDQWTNAALQARLAAFGEVRVLNDLSFVPRPAEGFAPCRE